MRSPEPGAVGYVVKRYPRYSETFIVNEILAHEEAGLAVEVFSLYPCTDTHFQDTIARVRAPVTYLCGDGPKASELWHRQRDAARSFPSFGQALCAAEKLDVREWYESLALALAVKEKGIRHLHAHFGSSATSVARVASILSGVPYTFTAHAKDIFHRDVRPDVFEEGLRGASATVTVSDFNLEYLRRTYGRSAQRVLRVYNGLDLNRFAFTVPAERSPVVLGVGRLVEKKGFSVLIEACALLRACGRRFTCTIVGEGEVGPALRALIEKLQLGDLVELTGPMPQMDVVRLIRESAVLAAPCVVGSDDNRDGLPTVLLEAMALGTPCVSTDVTGIPEVIKDGVTGLAVPQQDPQALANAIDRLLNDSSSRIRLARQARALIEKEFDVRQNAARLRELFAVVPPDPRSDAALVGTDAEGVR